MLEDLRNKVTDGVMHDEPGITRSGQLCGRHARTHRHCAFIVRCSCAVRYSSSTAVALLRGAWRVAGVGCDGGCVSCVLLSFVSHPASLMHLHCIHHTGRVGETIVETGYRAYAYRQEIMSLLRFSVFTSAFCLFWPLLACYLCFIYLYCALIGSCAPSAAPPPGRLQPEPAPSAA
jgi:hypothetical protein